MQFANADDFACKVQEQLQKVERRHRRTGEAIDELHEMARTGLQQFGPGAGCSGGVIAQIITPKNPK